MKRFLILLTLFLGTVLLFPQETDAKKDLLKKANEYIELLNTNPEKAFIEAKKIEKEAQRTNAKEAELQSINIQCAYYKTKNDFENLMITAKSLFQKAESYKFPVYQAIAKKRAFEAYIFSGLPDKAFQELQQGMGIITKVKDKDALTFSVKGDFFIDYANYYMLKKDNQNQLKYIKLSGEEFEKLSEGNYKQKLLYIYYSNLANAYSDMNQKDSAKFYAALSQSKDKEYKRNDITSSNLSNLGKAAMNENNYKAAVSYFKEAEKLEGSRVYLNTEELYDHIIESYQKLKQEDSVKIYQAKKDSLKINVAENQNKFLHNLLNEKDKNNSRWYFYIIAVLLILIMVLVLLILRKNKILAHQEKMSQHYLTENAESLNSENYSQLIEMFRNNNSAFMIRFEEVFPEFHQKLLSIYSGFSPMEIEFCALLKLKIPTKDIARYRYITHKTAQNKKYIIRKKLNIPQQTDIYEWFDKII